MSLISSALGALRAVGPGLEAKRRQSAKVLAEAILPPRVAVWRTRERRQSPAKASRIALTFDDGPNSLTPEYLATLAQLGVRATFFVVGEHCEKHPALVKQIAGEGHELAGHGYTHRRFTELSQSELSDELERTQALLPRDAYGRRLVRPPHGAVSLRSLLTCAQKGFTTVLWSFNSDDWRHDDASRVAGAFNARALEAGEIVLLHEGQTWTIKALPAIVAELEKAGHELCTVGDLLG
ncbi:MAG TPA: polysaccharide deacetylase family protein [Polyangiaceae bacterium]|jgi:peptidoglycan/xylan/chitin deacetylase (PgdA/CDA1 family)